MRHCKQVSNYATVTENILPFERARKQPTLSKESTEKQPLRCRDRSSLFLHIIRISNVEYVASDEANLRLD